MYTDRAFTRIKKVRKKGHKKWKKKRYIHPNERDSLWEHAYSQRHYTKRIIHKVGVMTTRLHTNKKKIVKIIRLSIAKKKSEEQSKSRLDTKM